jgi:glycosyltransferase involved in cell wall biosynthesis
LRVLIVTPTLGASPWLRATIESIGRLDVPYVHVLVAPENKVAALAATFPGSKVVAERGAGMYAAINTGIASENEWDAFTYVNDDDLLLPDFAVLARTVQNDGVTPVIAYGKVQLIDARDRRIGSIPLSPFPSLNRALYAQRLEPVYQHGTLVTRAAWQKLGPFDESLRFCGDSEFLARACTRDIRFRHVGGPPVAAFRLRTGQLTKNRAAMSAERIRVDQKLGLLAPRMTLRHHWARAVFRLANTGVYADRIRRFGFISFDELLRRAG